MLSMVSLPWLTILGALPLVGALVAVLVHGRARQVVSLVFAVATLGLAALAVAQRGDLDETYTWIPQIGVKYALRLDGLASMLLLVSTLLVVVVCIVVIGAPGKARSAAFLPLALALEGLALFTFMAGDALLFFVFFEATLVPMYFLISAGGDSRRSGAALKFLLYSLAGGLVLLGGIVYLMVNANSLLFTDLAKALPSEGAQHVLVIVFFIAFAVKAPLVPLHPWLPDAVEHGQPTSSVLLVGMLDGIGLYGMVRFCLGVTPQGATWAAFGLEIVSVVTIVYGALAAVASRSLLRMATFASISHAGFMVLGLFALTSAGLTGAMTYAGAHALSAAALLLVIEWVVARRGDTLTKGAFGGLARSAPVLAGLFLISGLATLALPGSANFAAEFPIIVGTWARYPVITAISLVGVLVAGAYVLWAYQRVFTGPESDSPGHLIQGDIGWAARLGAGLLLAGLLVFGVYPRPAQQLVDANTTQIMTQAQVSDPEPGGR